MDDRLAQLTPEQRRLFDLRKAQMRERDQLRRMLLPLQEGDPGRRPPLFCLHPPLGVTGYYVNITRHLPAEQPVFGCQNPHFVGLRDPIDTMEETAAYYLDAIRTVAPEGPYLLAGHSSGAYIAYEMARQLERAGEAAPVLFCIDAMAPTGPARELMQAFQAPDLEESVQAIFLCAWLVSIAYRSPLTFSMEDLAACSIDECYRRVAEYFKGAGFLPESAGDDMIPVILRCIAASTRADVAYLAQHTPEPPAERYRGQAVVLRCTEPTVLQGFDVTIPPDTSPASGWDAFCEQPPEVIGIEGADHVTLVLEPCCARVAEGMIPYLDRLVRA